jgi:hypothetical protein
MMTPKYYSLLILPRSTDTCSKNMQILLTTVVIAVAVLVVAANDQCSKCNKACAYIDSPPAAMDCFDRCNRLWCHDPSVLSARNFVTDDEELCQKCNQKCVHIESPSYAMECFDACNRLFCHDPQDD